MLPAMTLIAIGVLLALVWLIARFTESSEFNHQEVENAVLRCKNRARRHLRAIDCLPGDTQGREIARLLLDEANQDYQQVKSFNRQASGVARALERIEARREALDEGEGVEGLGVIEDLDESKEVRESLSHAYKHLQAMHEQGRLSATAVKSYGGRLKRAHAETAINTYCARAEKALSRDETRSAIHFYNLALSEAHKPGLEEAFAAKIQELETILAELQERAQQEAMAATAVARHEVGPAGSEQAQHGEAEGPTRSRIGEALSGAEIARMQREESSQEGEAGS